MGRYKTAHAWKDGDRFFVSTLPRSANGAANSYASANEVLRDAQARKMTITWENPDEVDKG